jgi:hypothetical protein
MARTPEPTGAQPPPKKVRAGPSFAQLSLVFSGGRRGRQLETRAAMVWAQAVEASALEPHQLRAMILGIVASTAFTLPVVPVAYFAFYGRQAPTAAREIAEEER